MQFGQIFGLDQQVYVPEMPKVVNIIADLFELAAVQVLGHDFPPFVDKKQIILREIEEVEVGNLAQQSQFPSQ